jgi:hypothetical protein
MSKNINISEWQNRLLNEESLSYNDVFSGLPKTNAIASELGAYLKSLGIKGTVESYKIQSLLIKLCTEYEKELNAKYK